MHHTAATGERYQKLAEENGTSYDEEIFEFAKNGGYLQENLAPHRILEILWQCFAVNKQHMSLVKV